MSRRPEDRQRAAILRLAEICKVPARDITPDDDLVADLGLDSPKALRLLVELEDELGVTIADEEAAGFRTVGDLLRALERA